MESFPFSEICAFCKIIRSEEKAYIVFEDAISLAFLDRRPVFPGHCLLVPNVHYESLVDLTTRPVAQFIQKSHLLELSILEVSQADSTLSDINTHVTQSATPLHIHLVTRNYKDSLTGFF